MNFMLDPPPDNGPTFAGAYVVLAKWYAGHAAVRRLWAINESQRIRIIVKLAPTGDGDDVYPAWLANGRQWAHELSFLEQFAADVDGVLVAELSWRDANMLPDDCDAERAELTAQAL